MSARGTNKRTREQWEDMLMRRLVRLKQHLGQWPSRVDVAHSLGCSERWVQELLKPLRDDGLVMLVGRGAACGWMPTSEGLRCAQVSMPKPAASAAPPRLVRARGVGAVRVWNHRQRLKARLASAEVFDRDADAPPGFDAVE